MVVSLLFFSFCLVLILFSRFSGHIRSFFVQFIFISRPTSILGLSFYHFNFINSFCITFWHLRLLLVVILWFILIIIILWFTIDLLLNNIHFILFEFPLSFLLFTTFVPFLKLFYQCGEQIFAICIYYLMSSNLYEQVLNLYSLLLSTAFFNIYLLIEFMICNR